MNELNYASVEASKKLVDTGIMLETDFYWVNTFPNIGWVFRVKGEFNDEDDFIPAPSMAEVLKELPNNTAFLKNKIYYASTGGKDNAYKEFISTNPTDALIELLIWLKGAGKMKKYTIDEITLRECMARGYCSPENENKVLDPELIEAMIKEIKECCDGDQRRQEDCG